MFARMFGLKTPPSDELVWIALQVSAFARFMNPKIAIIDILGLISPRAKADTIEIGRDKLGWIEQKNDDCWIGFDVSDRPSSRMLSASCGGHYDGLLITPSETGDLFLATHTPIGRPLGRHVQQAREILSQQSPFQDLEKLMSKFSP